MGRQDDVYVINAEDILENYAAEAGTRLGPRGLASVPADGEGGKSATRTRRSSGERSHPRAFIASSLSLFVCGAGQAYNGQWKLGILLFLTEVLAVAGHWSVMKLWPVLKDLGYLFAIGDLEIFVSLAVADFLLVFFLLYNIAQAYHQAEMEGDAFHGFRLPLVSGLASLLIPGWGQLLNAQLGKALFFLFCVLADAYAVALLMFTPFLHFTAELNLDRLPPQRATLIGMGIVLSGGLIWILSVYDAFLVAQYRRPRA